MLPEDVVLLGTLDGESTASDFRLVLWIWVVDQTAMIVGQVDRCTGGAWAWPESPWAAEAKAAPPPFKVPAYLNFVLLDLDVNLQSI